MKQIITSLIFLFSTCCLFAQNIVADIEFGKTSIEEARPKLIYKFGEPVIDEDEILIFKDVTYCGVFFDRAWFCFQRSTTNNYFYKCWFIRNNLKTAASAKEIREKIVDKIGDKYKILSKINSQGLKEYYVGVSPTDSTKPYFKICANKFASNDYSASVEYGPFDYIKENF